ncbi:aspartate aminotransferase family protein [Insolitispirillum peregrinum]|uniref:Acetylornithine aminotransferase n=1 Tax=Insolitispirillum peregrinum TaxID=80876 RepID=A0A1N7P3L7_9PROT|nr:aspartate aminotransferase family protein [Insolitispirillum peregrinum]SIT05029.1 acetylornithine/N-succinyldiaminopimelate aminotransferase [Insolitispirillum peregrinum]
MTIPVVMPTYARYDLAFERGEGAWLYTVDGRRFLDFGSGIAVTALGHAHPKLVKALQDQAAKVWHTSNLYHIPGQKRVAELLVANSFADTVFFCNSGAEANEGAIKMSRKFHQSRGSDRYRTMVCVNAFHGRTLATIAAGGQAKHLSGFAPMVQGFDHVPFGNLNEARAAITGETAAILVEPVQGEGGITAASADYLRGLRQMADEFGLLLMFDEVQTGIGRTGKLYAHQWADITPDIVTTAKGLGGGFPVGAILATEQAASAMAAGTHGTTYGGNPLAMACAEAVLTEVLSAGFLDGVNATAHTLWDGLRALANRYPTVISDVRGMGLMIGLKAVADGGNGVLVKELMERGMLTVPAGDNVVRLLPPLIVGEAEITLALQTLDAACAAIAQGTA